MIAQPRTGHALLRPLKPSDLDRIMEIERAAYPVPWTRGIFEDCLRVGYDCWGLHSGGRLVAYSVQTDAAGEAHLLNLCVEPGCQRQGFGSILLDNVLRLAHASGCARIFLEVRPSNTAARQLYQRRGFVVIGRRPGYYTARAGSASAAPAPGHLQVELPESAPNHAPIQAREDALVMQLDLQQV